MPSPENKSRLVTSRILAGSVNRRFPVKVKGEYREAEIRFGTRDEVAKLSRWRVPKHLPSDPLTARKMIDAVEFARLASNRWQYYDKAGEAVTRVDALRNFVEHHPKTEVAMVLMARPAWASPIPTLGFAYLRRSWCNSNTLPR